MNSTSKQIEKDQNHFNEKLSQSRKLQQRLMTVLNTKFKYGSTLPTNRNKHDLDLLFEKPQRRAILIETATARESKGMHSPIGQVFKYLSSIESENSLTVDTVVIILLSQPSKNLVESETGRHLYLNRLFYNSGIKLKWLYFDSEKQCFFDCLRMYFDHGLENKIWKRSEIKEALSISDDVFDKRRDKSRLTFEYLDKNFLNKKFKKTLNLNLKRGRTLGTTPEIVKIFKVEIEAILNSTWSTSNKKIIRRMNNQATLNSEVFFKNAKPTSRRLKLLKCFIIENKILLSENILGFGTYAGRAGAPFAPIISKSFKRFIRAKFDTYCECR